MIPGRQLHHDPLSAAAPFGEARWTDRSVTESSAWRGHDAELPATRLSDMTPDRLDHLIEELGDLWARGEATPAEVLLTRLSIPTSEEIVTLAYEEFCLAEQAGLQPEPTAFLKRFPEQRERLERLLGLHAAIDAHPVRLWSGDVLDGLPQVGDELGPYRLVRELGRGGSACVFLAEQFDLENRPVVVKISSRSTVEPRLLARVRHPHIVEVLRYVEAHDGPRTLHLLCMPFLGGATLADVLAERRRFGRVARTGSEFLTDLDQVAVPVGVDVERSGPAREIVTSLSYPKTIAWIVARLSEALDHAYTRGVTHGDLKPANVLLAADGRPYLFDFHLAVDWRVAWDPGRTPSDPGGTLAYMAPERLKALAASENASIPRPRDRHRADIYAMGLILAEALTGRLPEIVGCQSPHLRDQAAILARIRSQDRGFSRRILRTVPSGLRAIVYRCLAPDPADRYNRASELAEDLDRYRFDLAPRFAESGPVRHRLACWSRRRRWVIAAALLVSTSLVPAGVAGRQVQSELRRQAAVDKLEALWGGSTPGVYRARRDGERIPSSEVEPAHAAFTALSAYGLDEPGEWRSNPEIVALPQDTRLDLEAWLMEQAWRYANAVGPRTGSTTAWRRALAILERVGGPAPPAPLRSQVVRLRDLLNLPPTRPPERSTARWIEEYLLGVEKEASDPAAALKHYRRAVRLRPAAYWSHYRLSAAACAPEVMGYAEAERHLRQCLRIRPANPLLHLFRAGLLYHMKRPGAALDACNRALELAPELLEAYRTRFWIRQELFKPETPVTARRPDHIDPVSTDFRQLDLISPKDDLSRSWPLVLDALSAFGPQVVFPQGTESEAFARLSAAAVVDLDARWALANQLDALGRRADALAQFERVLAEDPSHLPARYSWVVMLERTGRPVQTELEAIVSHPGFEDFIQQYPYAIRAYHRLVREDIRADRVDQALEHARTGLAFSTKLRVLQGESHYAMARALAYAMRNQTAGPADVARQLKSASEFSSNFVEHWFADDPIFQEHHASIWAELQALQPMITPSP